MHDAAHRLGRKVVSRTHGIGSRLAKARDRGINQFWVQFFAIRNAKAKPVHHTGPVVFKQHISRLNELCKGLLAFGGLQIYRKRLFAAVAVGEIAGKLAHFWRP
ncbi:hypothetical protein SDC9_108270 [bioreactor metagenome]|uniref:Uncharacterized protein n=1 Tax=bioreactor metagenome TaxID=1076179 RepID=A0A645B7M2_9ZZZZ